MTEEEKLEALIKEYSQKLMEIVPKEQRVQMNSTANEDVTRENNKNREDENTISEQTESEDENKNEEDMLPQQEIIPDVETDPENFAYFVARVFAASGAFAVENAKIVIYKGDVLHAFLITDKNGETKRIKLASYPEINSLEPENKDQRLDYSADVYADGFTEQKDLLVSAVGGSEIVLNVALVPESEGIN